MDVPEIYSSIIYMGLCIHKQLRIEHLRTSSHAHHDLFEKTADKLLELVDTFAETAIGQCDDMDECIVMFLEQDKHSHSPDSLLDEIRIFQELLMMDLKDTVLQSIADALLVELARFRYLNRQR